MVYEYLSVRRLFAFDEATETINGFFTDAGTGATADGPVADLIHLNAAEATVLLGPTRFGTGRPLAGPLAIPAEAARFAISASDSGPTYGHDPTDGPGLWDVTLLASDASKLAWRLRSGRVDDLRDNFDRVVKEVSQSFAGAAGSWDYFQRQERPDVLVTQAVLWRAKIAVLLNEAQTEYVPRIDAALEALRSIPGSDLAVGRPNVLPDIRSGNRNLFRLDNSKKFTDQKHVGHNRWHPDIPPNVTVKPGDVFRADCREWFDGAITNDDSADDVRNAPLAGVHVLSGPFRVEGAQPGDLLIVDILEIDACDQEHAGPFAGMGWGYTGVFATANGGGFLTERFPDAYKVIWDFTGDVATSRHIPECSYVGIHHPGLMGTAPSADLLAKWTKRETDLIATDPGRIPPLALPPLPDSAILGTLSGAEFDRVAREAARTTPPRENGGNQDIKNFTAGTRVFYPVFVEGANLSFGDLHFSQGDGEITFCGAIEMGGFMDLHVDLIKGGMATYGIYENAIFMPGLRDPHYSEWIAFSGVSVDLAGKQHYLDSQLSYERACHHAIDYLMKFGYSDIQAYMILGSAPIEGRFSGVVDIPNSCATVYIPTRIFEFDVSPSSGGPHQVTQGLPVPKSANYVAHS